MRHYFYDYYFASFPFVHCTSLKETPALYDSGEREAYIHLLFPSPGQRTPHSLAFLAGPEDTQVSILVAVPGEGAGDGADVFTRLRIWATFPLTECLHNFFHYHY